MSSNAETVDLMVLIVEWKDCLFVDIVAGHDG